MDPYKTLGIDRSADASTIKSAYRRLASKHHPDRGGDTATFQSIQAAYDILGDPHKKREFDNPQPKFNGFPGQGFGNINDFFNNIFNQQQRKLYTVTVFVTLEQIVKGSVENVQINTPAGVKLLQLKIPTEIEDGYQVSYDGIMQDGLLQVQYRVHRHPVFTKKGKDLYSQLQVNVLELITGTTAIINDIRGNGIEIKIDRMTKPGSKLRLPGRGIDGGDHYLLIDGTLPDKIGEDTLNQIHLEVKRNKNEQ